MERKDIRKDLISLKDDFDLINDIPCSLEENEICREMLKRGEHLPEGVYRYNRDNTKEESAEFYTVHEVDLTKEELEEYIALSKLRMLRTIKNCVVFFTTITIIGMIVAFLVGLGAI